MVNSVYDPLGLAAPVLLHGRLLLQQLVSMGKKKTATAPLGWDDPLPEELSLGWQSWKNALPDLSPEFLRNPSEITTPGTEQAILSPNDPELRKDLKPLTTSTKLSGSPTLGTERFKRYSSWPSLRRAIAILIAKVKSLKERNTSDKPSQSVHYQHQSPDVIDRAAKVIIKAVQREAFKEEFEVIAQSSSENDSSRNEAKARKKSLKKSTLYQLDPYVDDAGILRVGGRLRQTNLSFNEKHPVL